MTRDDARRRCVLAVRLQHHLLDARARGMDLDLRDLVRQLDRMLAQIEPIRAEAWRESGQEEEKPAP